VNEDEGRDDEHLQESISQNSFNSSLDPSIADKILLVHRRAGITRRGREGYARKGIVFATLLRRMGGSGWEGLIGSIWMDTAVTFR